MGLKNFYNPRTIAAGTAILYALAVGGCATARSVRESEERSMKALQKSQERSGAAYSALADRVRKLELGVKSSIIVRKGGQYDAALERLLNRLFSRYQDEKSREAAAKEADSAILSSTHMPGLYIGIPTLDRNRDGRATVEELVGPQRADWIYTDRTLDGKEVTGFLLPEGEVDPVFRVLLHQVAPVTQPAAK